MIIKFIRLAFIVLIGLGLAACTAHPEVTPPPAVITMIASPSRLQPTAALVIKTASPEVAPTQTPHTAPTTTLAPAATQGKENLSTPRVVVLAQGLAGPDDLALAPDGSIYVSDVISGKVQQIRADGSVSTVISGLSEPEGMLFLPDGRLIIAEQGKNRLMQYDFKTKQLEQFLVLKNQTGQAGVDGIVLDAHDPSRETILIPDSPNGAVRQASLDGKTLTTLATGFARPTGAWVEPDGSLLVVDENAGKLARIRPDGKEETLASLSIPDDVVEDPAGNIFVATLGDHAIHIITETDHHNRVLLADLNDPQGIILGSDGNLIAADQGNHRVIEVMIHQD